MTDDRELMRVHVEALFTLDTKGRLVAVNEPGGAPAPRFFLGRTWSGSVAYFRHDLEDATIRALEILRASEGIPGDLMLDPARDAPFLEHLAQRSAVQRIWTGPAFRFPPALPVPADAVSVTMENAELLTPYLEPWRDDAASGVPMAAVLVDGRAVAVCCSVRVTARADEAGVETHPAFRRRGHAAAAVRAWATLVRERGRMPLYSTSWDNEGSCALARRLGLVQYGVTLHVS